MSNLTMRKSLKERAKEFSVQLPFMEGREKGDIKELVAQYTTITEYGFLKGKAEDGSAEERDYVVFIVNEDKKHFFFGGTVLTDQLQQLEAEGYHDDIVMEGLPMLLTEKKSKNKRTYINVEFYPE